MSRKRSTFLSAVAAFGLIFGLGAAASPAAAEPIDKDAAALAVYERVEQAADPDAAVDALSPTDRELFIYAVTPAGERIVEAKEGQAISLAATCRTETVRGQGYSHIGLALYDFWTTGQICYNGGVSSATYIDGGGWSGALGWSYTGTHASQGIVNGWGYASGTHYFQLVVGGVVVRSPVGCARVVGSPGGAVFGQVGICGIG